MLAWFWGLSAGLSYELPMIADEIRKANKLKIIVRYNKTSGEQIEMTTKIKYEDDLKMNKQYNLL